MSTNREFEPIARAFMAAGPTQLADRVLKRSLADVHHTRQRRALLRAPWRTPVMNIYAKLAAAAVAVVAVGALGIWFLNSGSSSTPVGGAPGPSASPSEATAPSAVPRSSSVPLGIPAPPLSQNFTSARNGITLAVPEGWTTRPATEAWEGGLPNYDEAGGGDATGDVIQDPVLTDHIFMTIASMPLGGATAEQWATDQYASDYADDCPDAGPITIGGATGVIAAGDCSPHVVFVAKGDRGYLIMLRVSPDEPWLAPVYDRAWFESVLATVQLHPEDAVD
jgi:hypothetical protein